jgi:solute:Na+ symporter, SSS family
MPYIALQLVGIKAVLTVLGLGSSENVLLTDLPLILAFVVLVAYTYTSGLRAPAMIAVVKDLLIYLPVIVAVIYPPIKFGGWDAIFGAAKTKLDTVNEAMAAKGHSGEPRREVVQEELWDHTSWG